MSELDYASLPSPRFAILDIVRVSIDDDPELSSVLGTVNEIRYYRDRGYRYGVGGEWGGILDDAMLAATGDRDTTRSFWHGPLRKGDVVEISPEYPKRQWHGFFAVINSCWDDREDSYGVQFTLASRTSSGVHKKKYRDIEHRFLIPNGDRIPPQPVPRPATTFRANADKGIRPAHEFSIIDEIDQYL